jgi:hypothetical protein
MKQLFVVLITIASAQSVFADPACTALSSTVGVYQQASKTCDLQRSMFSSYQYVQVAAAQDDRFSGFTVAYAVGPNADQVANWIGATTAPGGDTFFCSTSGNTIVLRDCGIEASNRNCGPGSEWMTYTFSGNNLDISEGGCQAHYLKVN